jgi:predicted NBD/HSP70 family sugar kinase
MVTMGAVAGDPVALESFEAVGTWLGYGMADLAAILDPRVFIIGGGVSEAGELLAGPARETFQANLTAHGHRPRGRARPGRGADRRRRPGPEVTPSRCRLSVRQPHLRRRPLSQK